MATVLAIDQGKRSGWALFTNSRTLHAYGLATNHAHRRAAIEQGQALAAERGNQLVVCLEGHDHLPASLGANTTTLIGLGIASGRWRETAEMLGHPSRRLITVGVKDWRRRVLGKQKRAVRRNVVKKMAQNAALQLLRVDCTDDEAEAMCIGLSCYSHPQVEAVVKASFRGVSWEPELAKWRR